jgi:hypothetical protein
MGRDRFGSLGKEMKLFAGLEAHCFARSNRDLGPCSGITSDAGLARFYGKDAETAKFNTITRDEGLFHAFEDGVYGGLCFRSWQAGTLNNPLYKILLNHLGRRPWAVIFEKINTDLV